MECWQQVQTIAESLGLPAVIKVLGKDPEREPEPLWSPSPGYLETGRLGPVSVRSIEWIDLISEVSIPRGRLLQPIVEDRQAALLLALRELGIPHEPAVGSVRVHPRSKASQATVSRDDTGSGQLSS